MPIGQFARPVEDVALFPHLTRNSFIHSAPIKKPAVSPAGFSILKRCEPAVKPGSVLCCQSDNHSSRTYVTARLKQPTRPQRGPRQWGPIWSCSGWSLPCHELLPAARCALTAPFHPYLIPLLLRTMGHRRFALCCTGRRLTPPRRYLAPCPVEPGLSSPCLRRQRLSWPTHGAHYTPKRCAD
jgi:hypothetical protein